MAGHRPFSELTKGFSQVRRARVAGTAIALREAMTQGELRKAIHSRNKKTQKRSS
jgi:hypothetical protein